MIPLPAAAVERKCPTTIFCTDRIESLGNFCQRGLPVNRVKSAVGPASQRRGQPVGVVLIEVESLRFLTQIPVRTGMRLVTAHSYNLPPLRNHFNAAVDVTQDAR